MPQAEFTEDHVAQDSAQNSAPDAVQTALLEDAYSSSASDTRSKTTEITAEDSGPDDSPTATALGAQLDRDIRSDNLKNLGDSFDQELQKAWDLGGPAAVEKFINQVNKASDNYDLKELWGPSLSEKQQAKIIANPDTKFFKVVNKESDLTAAICSFKPELTRAEDKQRLAELEKAIDSSDLRALETAVTALAKDPASANRVLEKFKSDLEARDYKNDLSWSVGTKNTGEPTIDVQLQHQNDQSKSSGATVIHIGENRRTRAEFTENWDSEPRTIDASTATMQFRRKGSK